MTGRSLRLLGAAFTALFLFRLTVPLLGYRRIERFFPRPSSAPPDAFARRVAIATQSAARLVPGATCLMQACAARALFGLRGYRVTMRVGVREADGSSIAAHAWLLAGDQVILGSAVEDFDEYRPIGDFG